MSQRLDSASRPPAALYPIRAVARLTGLGIDTLRAWERRHGAVTPIRDDRGRLYTDADVQRLRLLHELVTRGHSIGRIAGLPEEELRRVAETPLSRGGGAASDEERSSEPSHGIDSLMVAVEAFDSVTLETELGRAALLLRPQELLSAVLLPLLARVGDNWHAGRGTAAQEHFVAACVRSVLGTVLRAQRPRDHGTRLLFATPASERHELGTLGAALLAAANGFGVVYLGADLPSTDLVSSAAASGVDIVVLGVTGASPTHDVSARVADTAHTLPAAVGLWIGGPAARLVAGHLAPRVTCVPTYDDLQTQLEQLRVSDGRTASGSTPDREPRSGARD